MEREKFLQYRDRIVEILLSEKEIKAEAPYLCVSALNEIKAAAGLCYRLLVSRAVDCEGNDKT